MVLIDTNVLVALLNEREPLRALAAADLARLRRAELKTTSIVIAETCHLLQSPMFRLRLQKMLREWPIEVIQPAIDIDMLLGWMIKYEEHDPDLADAELVFLTAVEPRFRVWSYDPHFWKAWRRPNGTAIPLATKSRP